MRQKDADLRALAEKAQQEQEGTQEWFTEMRTFQRSWTPQRALAASDVIEAARVILSDPNASWQRLQWAIDDWDALNEETP